MYNLGSRRYYIRSVFAIPDQQKMEQEQKSLIHIDDSFKKIIVVKDRLKHWQSEKELQFKGMTEWIVSNDGWEQYPCFCRIDRSADSGDSRNLTIKQQNMTSQKTLNPAYFQRFFM